MSEAELDNTLAYQTSVEEHDLLHVPDDQAVLDGLDEIAELLDEPTQATQPVYNDLESTQPNFESTQEAQAASESDQKPPTVEDTVLQAPEQSVNANPCVSLTRACRK